MVRETQAPDAPSRSGVIFASPDLVNAERFMRHYPGYGDTLFSLEISQCQAHFEADMGWLNAIPSHANADEAAVQVQAYWKQRVSDDPIMEVLVQGEIMVIEPAIGATG
jgi:hypothetical protein